MKSSVRDERTDVYRYYDTHGALLYVGISFSAIARAAQHRSDKGWWQDVARMDVEHHPTRADALAAESAAIKTEKPIHNVMGNSGATRAPWRCEDCKRHIGITPEDGYLQVDRDDDWHCVCAKCDTIVAPRYWIDAARITDLESLDRFTQHLCEKSWFDQSTWVQVVRRCSTLPMASSHAFLAFDAHRDRMRRHMMRGNG